MIGKSDCPGDPIRIQESPLIFLHGVAEPDDICTTLTMDFDNSISLRVRKRSVARG
jgi:hypothetical protein